MHTCSNILAASPSSRTTARGKFVCHRRQVPRCRSYSNRVGSQTCHASQPDFGERAKRFVRQRSRDFGTAFGESARKVNTRVEEAVVDADRKWNISKRVANTLSDVRRKFPYYKQKLDKFSSTTLGKGALWGLFFASIYTGVLFKVLNFLILLWWVLPILALPFAGALRKKQEQRMKEAQALREEQQRAARNPFSNFPGMGGMGGTQYRRPQKNKIWQDEGPVIDAEYSVLSTVDDDGSSKRA